MNPVFYYLDPTIGSTGAYVSYNAFSQTASNNSATAQYLQAGQGFFVLTSATSPSLTITETDKAATSIKSSVFGTSSASSRLVFTLNKLDNGTAKKMDIATAVFASQFSNTIGREDAEKMKNNGENLAIINATKSLSIDARSIATENDQLPLSLSGLSNAAYELNIDASAYSNASTQAYLFDAVKNTTTALTNGINTISFTAISTDAASFANRFTVVFKLANKATATEVIAKATYNVYPNPMVGNKVNLQLSNVTEGAYNVIVTNMLGQIVSESLVNHAGGTATHNIAIASKLASGTYSVTVNSTASKQVVYQTNIAVK